MLHHPLKHVAGWLALGVVLPLLALGAGAVSPAGTVRLEVTTRSTGGKYSPRHVLAVWVTDAQGRFVRTLMLKAKRQRSRLVAWQASSSGNTVGLTDAVTGATATQHRAITVDWDCRDAAGAAVPDGWYRILVEFSERNGSGPLTPPGAIRVRKGPEPYAAEPGDLEFFRGMRVSYRPLVSPPPPTRPAPAVVPRPAK